MEDYKAKFERLMQRIDKLIVNGWIDENAGKAILKDFAVESEDERIRKSIIDLVEKQMPKSENKKWMISWLEKQGEKIDVIENFDTEFEKQLSHLIASTINKEYEYTSDFIKWTANALLNYAKHELEKQGEQKPNDKVETKFKAGDWIINSVGTLRHIVTVDKTGYETDKGWLTHDDYEKIFHLWTIKDAKDGDVLATKNFIFIFKNIDNDNGIRYYCDYEISEHDEDNQFAIAVPQCVMGRLGNGLSYYSPATEEQCNLLFSKMKEAGYDWDSEKKELRKIEQKPEINDDVLSRFAFYQYDNDTIYLSSLFVRESDRKCGYGSKILKAAEEVAKTFGISKIRLKVESNTWMEEWYKKNGYEYLSAEGEYDWFEKQVEQNREPKFNVGDWLVCCNYEPEQIIGIRNNMYEMSNGDIRPINMINNNHNIRLWTIKDAKDGDVLYHKSPLTGIEYIVMSRGINSFGNVDSYFRYNSEDGFGIYIPSIFNAKVDDIKPATKEQRDLLFQEMKEAGYEWDAEKKELKKIEQKSIDKTKPKFKVGDVIRAKGGAAKYTIRSVTNTTYYTDGWSYDIESCEEEYELVEQNPTWSEEDEKMLKSVISSIRISRSSCEEDDDVRDLFDNEIDWLKSLKERYTWKPSNEQMKQLGWVAVQNKDNMIGKELMPLYQDLKKLKGE